MIRESTLARFPYQAGGSVVRDSRIDWSALGAKINAASPATAVKRSIRTSQRAYASLQFDPEWAGCATRPFLA